MSFELTDEEAEAMAWLFCDPDYEFRGRRGSVLAAAAKRYRETRIVAGDIVHHAKLDDTWADRMEVVHVHAGKAWVADADGDHIIASASSLRKGERP